VVKAAEHSGLAPATQRSADDAIGDPANWREDHQNYVMPVHQPRREAVGSPVETSERVAATTAAYKATTSAGKAAILKEYTAEWPK
jgi:hypothetical protein